jgi:hypothetical protein
MNYDNVGVVTNTHKGYLIIGQFSSKILYVIKYIIDNRWT